MQKVEGSNPFSRSREGLHLQVFFPRQSVRASASQGTHWAPAPAARAPRKPSNPASVAVAV